MQLKKPSNCPNKKWCTCNLFNLSDDLCTTCLAALLHAILVLSRGAAARWTPVVARLEKSGWYCIKVGKGWPLSDATYPKKCRKTIQMSIWLNSKIDSEISIHYISNVLETHPLLQLWIVLVLRKVTDFTRLQSRGTGKLHLRSWPNSVRSHLCGAGNPKDV